MALTNAQRQKRYREKLKAAARSGSRGHDCAAELRSMMVPEEDKTRLKFLHRLVYDPPREELGPMFAGMLGLPRDPWPGLTADDLKRMIAGRRREAKRRHPDLAEYWVWRKSWQPGFVDKLNAALDRKWLERGVRRGQS